MTPRPCRKGMPAFSFPETCPTCGEPAQRKWDKHPHHTRYKCGSTTMMLAEGFHVEGRDPRQEALWKQHLAKTGRTMRDPML